MNVIARARARSPPRAARSETEVAEVPESTVGEARVPASGGIAPPGIGPGVGSGIGGCGIRGPRVGGEHGSHERRHERGADDVPRDGAQQRRAHHGAESWALALATEAKALLLDEPTSGLDPAASHEFSQLLRKLAGDGVAVLMATHDLFRAREDANRIGILRAGQLAGNYTSEELKGVDLEQLYLQHLGK